MQTILVVDNDDMMRTLMLDILGEKYKVILAPDGEIGLGLFEKNETEIRLVITDLIMPVMNGFEMSKAIRALSLNVKIIVYSSSISLEECQILFGLAGVRVSKFLSKPTRVQEIKKLVGKLLQE